MAPIQHLFESRSMSMTVVVYGGSGGMEPTVLIVVIDGGVGSLC